MLHLVFFLCLFFTAFFSSSLTNLVAMVNAVELLDVGQAALQVNKYNIEQHVKFFSSLGSRVTGYPGFFEAAEYIAEKFSEYGIEPYSKDGGYFEWYNISIPIDQGSSITLFDGDVIEAYKFWPNYGVNPAPYVSPETGDWLIYLGRGEDEDFIGKDLNGKFVLMEFCSRWYFKRAIDYGAKGVIFIGPSSPEETIMRTEVEQKMLNLPLPIPILYVPHEKGKILKDSCLKNGEVLIYLNSNMSWKNIQVPNIVGIIRGVGSQSDEQIVISAYYDSWSIVPRLSPGASEALGISILLDFARFLSENRHPRSVVLVALSGHHQGLAGAREFVERHFSEIGSKIKVFIGMDISSDTDQIGIFSIGSSYTFFNIQNFNLKYGALVNKFFVTYLGQMRRVLGSSYGINFVDGITKSYPPYIINNPPYDLQISSSRMFDSDPFVVACFGGGFTYHTVNALRRYFRTMFDTYERVNFNNVWPQTQFIFSTLWGLANEPVLPSLFLSPARVQSDWGYTTLKVRVTTYNATTNYYDPFNKIRHPEEIKQVLIKVVSMTVSVSGTEISGYSEAVISESVGMLETTVLADENGEATIVGLKPFSIGVIDAFVVNSTNGNIEWVTDLGVHSYEGGKIVRMSSAFVDRPISVFRCGSIALLNLINPVELRPFTSATINNYLSHGMMLHQSFVQSGYDYMFFVEPNTPVELLFSVGRGFPGGVLINASFYNPYGSGFLVAPGECLILGFSSARMAEEIFAISSQRYEKLSELNAINPQIAIYYNLTNNFVNQMRADVNSSRMDKLFGDSYAAWAYGMLSYHYIMDHLYSVISSMVLFFFLLVPFSLLIEEFLVGEKSGLRRVLTTVITFTLALGILVSFHPGFYLATGVSTLFMSIGLLTLVLFTVGIILSEFLSVARELRRRLGGHHFIEVSRGSVISRSFSIGVRYMKKRSFRCVLTLASLAIIVSSLITFTSIALAPSPLKEIISGEATYRGILLRSFPWGSVPESFYHQLKSQLKDTCDVIPRGWIYPPSPPAGMESRIFLGPKQIASISAILALSPEEINVSKIDRILISDSRWFREEETFVCIISNRLVNLLKVEFEQDVGFGSQISLWGLNLTIIGIFDGDLLWSGSEGILDLDQEPITPIQQQAAGAITILPPHLDGDSVIIIPYRLFEMLHPQFANPISIVIKPYAFIDPSTVINNLVNQFVLRFPLRVYFSNYENEIILIRPFQWFAAIGVANLMLPLIIGALTMLNIMMGQIYERIRDIRVYNAIGLSPSHIMGLFLTESCVYGIISGVIGYELGISAAYTLRSMNLYPPGFYLNYSSIFVLTIVGIAILVSILSGLYPAYIASKIEIPSLERRWKIPPPKGDLWEISLPFVVTEIESLSLLAFLKEYLERHSTEQVGLFAVEKVELAKEKIDSINVERLFSSLHIAPYDMGIYQEFTVEALSSDGKKYNIALKIKRKSGVQDIWVKSNKTFIDMIRKQILIWRTLRPSEREIYDKIGLEFKAHLLGEENV